MLRAEQLCDYTNKKYWVVHFKWVNHMMCELYLKAVYEKNCLDINLLIAA